MSNRCGDITFFVIFKMAATAFWDFQKFEILTVGPLYASMRVTKPNFIEIGRPAAEIWQFNGVFLNDGRPPSWICWARIGTTRVDNLVVSIIV